MRLSTYLLGLLTIALLSLAGCARGPAPEGNGNDDAAAADHPADATSPRATPSPDSPPADTRPWIPETDPLTQDSRPIILFLGNSLTAGYGLTPEEAFPALIQEKIDSAGYHYRVVNAGVSGETSAGGARRIDWLLQNPIAILVLELGANDALRGQDLRATRANLQTIVDRTLARYPEARIIIAGMEAPPNLGPAYTEEFRNLFIELARENDAALIPFLLDGVGGVPELNQSDGIHPTAEGHRIMAEHVWRTLESILREGE